VLQRIATSVGYAVAQRWVLRVVDEAQAQDAAGPLAGLIEVADIILAALRPAADGRGETPLQLLDAESQTRLGDAFALARDAVSGCPSATLARLAAFTVEEEG
jgi:hypothetical protein